MLSVGDIATVGVVLTLCLGHSVPDRCFGCVSYEENPLADSDQINLHVFNFDTSMACLASHIGENYRQGYQCGSLTKIMS